MRSSFFLVILGGIIGIGGTLAGVYLGFHLQIPFLIPNEPKLDIDYESTNLALHRFKQKGFNEDITIRIRNLGRMGTGKIYISVDRESGFYGRLPEGIPYLEVEGGTTYIAPFFLRRIDCHVEEPEDIFCEPNLTSGRYKLELLYNCDGCSEEKFSNIVEICIWDINSSECED